MCEKTRSAIERQAGVAHAGFQAFSDVHAGRLIEQQQTRTLRDHRLPAVRRLDGQSSAQADVHFDQRLARHDFLSNRIEQAVDGQDEEIAVQSVELVAPMAVGAVDSQAAGLRVSIRILADDFPTCELAEIPEQLAQRTRGLPANQRRAEQARRRHGIEKLRSIPAHLSVHGRSVGRPERFWPISSPTDRSDSIDFHCRCYRFTHNKGATYA
jgi:hypothetical protein